MVKNLRSPIDMHENFRVPGTFPKKFNNLIHEKVSFYSLFCTQKCIIHLLEMVKNLSSPIDMHENFRVPGTFPTKFNNLIHEKVSFYSLFCTQKCIIHPLEMVKKIFIFWHLDKFQLSNLTRRNRFSSYITKNSVECKTNHTITHSGKKYI